MSSSVVDFVRPVAAVLVWALAAYLIYAAFGWSSETGGADDSNMGHLGGMDGLTQVFSAAVLIVGLVLGYLGFRIWPSSSATKAGAPPNQPPAELPLAIAKKNQRD